MKILFFNWEFPPQGSGVGRYIDFMTQALVAAGHECVVVAVRAEGYPECERQPGRTIYRLYDYRDIGSPWIARRVLELAREHQVDLIEGAEHFAELVDVLKASSRPPVLIKMHYNDFLYRLRYAQACYPWQRWMIDAACLRRRRIIRGERFSVEWADLLTAPCQRILDECRVQGITLPKHCGVIPNPVICPDGWQNREAEKPTVLLVGRTDIGKGIQYLGEMMERIWQQMPETVLELAGGDSYARGLGSMSKWLQRRMGAQSDRIKFLGFCSPEQIDEAYRRAWVVIVPSRWDTFPTVVLESMARRKAIVASPNGGMPEMLEDSGGVIAKPESPEFAEAVLTMLGDSTIRQQAGESVRARAEQVYAPSVVARQYLDFVQEALS